MKLLKYFLIVLLIPCLVSCDDDDEGSVEIKELTVELSKSKILDDGIDAVFVLVTDQKDRNVNTEVEIYADQQLLADNKFTSTETGTVTIHAKYNDITSNNAEVTVVEDAGLEFYNNVLIEQFTGTWCGWCPRAIYQVDYLMGIDSAVNHIAYHLEDELIYIYNRDLYDYFGLQYVPVMAADRKKEWDGTVSEVTAMHAPQRVGLTMAVEGDCNTLDIHVQAKFGKIFAESLTLTVYLLHDSLVADQTNYYDDDPASVWFEAGDPMVDFVHRNTMVKTATNMYGDLIPTDSIDIGSTFTKDISIGGFTCNDIKQIRVVAFVSYGSGVNFFTVINSMSCAWSEEKNYELVVK